MNGEASQRKKPVKKAEIGPETPDERAVHSEFEALARHVRKGRLISTWEAKHIGNEVLARISEHMAKGLDVETAIDVTRRMRRVMDNGQEFWTEKEPDKPDFWQNPAGGGGFTKFPHDAEGLQVAKCDGTVPDGPSADADKIYEQMSENYPPQSISWIKKASWVGPISLHEDMIDMDDVENWSASHEPDRVAHFKDKIKAGEKMKPAVAVLEPGEDKVKIIDGHHRTLAFIALDAPVLMYVGRVSSKDGAWDETHSFQVHPGSEPQNKGWGDEKVSKDSVNYRPSDDPSHSCGTCSMFRPGGACTLVAGAIESQDVCDEWDPR